jgi:anti-sigma factor RsiW
MVAEMHPHDIELFEYVEDELPQARREEIAAHLATCGVCAAQVELAAAGREALRGTELLELPEDRREAILRNLPAPERVVGEGRAFSPKLVLAGLTALLLLAAVIGVLVNSNPNSGDLRKKGFKASLQKDRVVVRGATEEQVREALADRGPGDVEVVVKNP